MINPTQDQLKALFNEEFNDGDDHVDGGIDKCWHWITTVYDQKVRDEGFLSGWEACNQERKQCTHPKEKIKICNFACKKCGTFWVDKKAREMNLDVSNFYKQLAELSQLPTPDKDYE